MGPKFEQHGATTYLCMEMIPQLLIFAGKTYFETKIGILMSTMDGKYIALEPNPLPTDLKPALVPMLLNILRLCFTNFRN
jgi:hypothetical protein